MRAEISIIIVSWKVKDLLDACLGSIYAHSLGIPVEVIVVDNNSQDGTVEMVRSRYGQTRIIDLEINAGFAKACNLGAREANGQYLFFLNPDTEFIEDSATKIISWFRATPSASVLGCKLVYPDRRLQMSVRRFPTLSVLVLILLKIHRIFPRLKALKNYLWDDFLYSHDEPVQQVMGAALVVRKDIFNALGGFDEKYFVWFEEVDLCNQIIKSGGTVWYSPTTSILHHGAQSFIQTPTFNRQIAFVRSALRYARRRISVFAWLVLLPVALLSYFFGAIVHVAFFRYERR